MSGHADCEFLEPISANGPQDVRERKEAARGVSRFFSTHSGAGGPECAARELGLELCGGVEIEEYPVNLYRANFGDHIRHESILNTPLSDLPGGENLVFWSSPQCKHFSSDKRSAGETLDDIAQATWVADAIEKVKPEAFVLENVRGYLKSRSYHRIYKKLIDLNYRTKVDIVNAADFGAPTSRVRLILRASRSSLPDLVPTTPWPRQSSWYDAIRDLLPTLRPTFLTERQKASFAVRAKWEKGSPCIIERTGYGNRLPTLREAYQLCWTIKASAGCDQKGAHRSPITYANNEYDAYHLDYRCLARIQGFPDNYVWGDSRGRNNYAIGNAVPVPLALAVLKSFA